MTSRSTPSSPASKRGKDVFRDAGLVKNVEVPLLLPEVGVAVRQQQRVFVFVRGTFRATGAIDNREFAYFGQDQPALSLRSTASGSEWFRQWRGNRALGRVAKPFEG
jgi:hypothetical protein